MRSNLALSRVADIESSVRPELSIARWREGGDKVSFCRVRLLGERICGCLVYYPFRL